jgi:hypothetical protein
VIGDRWSVVGGRLLMVGPGALLLRQPPSHPGGMAEHSRGSASIAAARPSRDADPRMQRTGIAPRRGARSRPHSAASCPFSNESVCTGSRRSLVGGRCAAVGRWVVVGVLAPYLVSYPLVCWQPAVGSVPVVFAASRFPCFCHPSGMVSRSFLSGGLRVAPTSG